MPLLIRWPGHVQPGTVCDKLVLNLDFAETFLDCAGAPVPADMQGRSFRPLLEGNPPPDWRRSMYYRYYEFPAVHSVQKHYGVRTDRYKLICYHELGEWELFDLEKDPDELKSVYADPACAGVVNELKAELEKLKAQYKDHDVEPRPPAKAKPKAKPRGKPGRDRPAPVAGSVKLDGKPAAGATVQFAPEKGPARKAGTDAQGMFKLELAPGKYRVTLRAPKPAAEARPVPVTGFITLEGKPLAGATVRFVPEKGRPAVGTTGDDGRFRLTTFSANDGALPGRYRVTIAGPEAGPGGKPGGSGAAKEKPSRAGVPPMYSRPQTSPLLAEVSPDGPNEFRLELGR